MAWYTPIPQNDPPSKVIYESKIIKVLVPLIHVTRSTTAFTSSEAGTERMPSMTCTFWT